MLRAVAAELEGEGIQVVDSTLFLTSILAPDGAITSHLPDERQWRDIHFGS